MAGENILLVGPRGVTECQHLCVEVGLCAFLVVLKSVRGSVAPRVVTLRYDILF